MDPLQVAKLCRVIAHLIPQQKFDDETPTMWSVPLADVSQADAHAAVRRLVTLQPYIGVGDIVREAHRARQARLAELDARLVPNVDPDDPMAWAAELRALRQAAASGTLDMDAYARGGRTLTGAAPLRALGAGQ